MPHPKGNDQETRQTEVRQRDENCSDEDDSGRLGSSAIQSGKIRHDEDRTNKPICPRRSSDRHTNTEQGKIFGGILRQLIAENDDQLAEYRSKIEKLEKRRHQLQELYAQLQQELDSSEDDELSDEVE